MIIKEFCAENTTLLNQLDQSVKRVELCDNLAVGGTTPSYGVIKEAARYLHEKDIALATMIRPRGGNFVYNDSELRIMEDDILHAVELESDSLVLGLLTEDNHIDQDGIEQLLPATQGLPLVFHMAFDHIPLEEQKEALDQLVELGFTRILTHGSAQNNDIFENIAHLKDLVDYADGRIEIMIGGGVTADNYQELVEKTGAQAAHGTKINCVL
ncbi:copper homeostasis protein CutC [Streptococcus gallolyticus subsp. gallolyticus]|uniref:copper homeostasis protein CutC n=1 Tax=Streptococcus gallolyticus TaxID=315405 RepID=UPI0001E0F3EE|nr:copper homeostasis protein CutC [Streptococcus gallolyticus]EFM29002.1 CutC family protein [Streptococcus gallolyticus subsp. gallolyticus TX20005]MCY7201669.1 copper homeostasis protein CutC [Streptococcus gallolyticus subsp. gallolyticus]QKI00250.1 copper homeostasis protein CutC [Streptococcus gallolyticus]QWX86320.1 copper homeostasis protein CutC [Streptococcus gallolyticus subsp. gallolyticus TX20005]